MAGKSDEQDKTKNVSSVTPSIAGSEAGGREIDLPVVEAASESIEVVVVVKAREIAHTERVAERLADEGMVVDGIMAGYGAVVGQAESDKVRDLAKVKGVLRVETDKTEGTGVYSAPLKERVGAEVAGSAKARHG